MCSSHIQDSFCRIFLFETIKQKKGRNGNAEEAADTAGLDAESRTILHSKEVLAVILLETVEEYKGYSIKEVMDFIEADSITECEEVSAGRTNTQVRGDNPEFVHLNEKASHFDVMFRARNPRLSRGRVIVNLHINVESQKTYRPGYPHQSNFMDTISEYIDFSNNEELWKETEHMEGLGESILREGIEQGIEQGIEEGMRLMIEALQEVKQSKKFVTDMVMQKFGLPQDEAETKTEKYWNDSL